MKNNKRWLQAIVSGFLLVLAGIGWIACAPVQAGGLASYVIIRGVSMEPDFHAGDLVIVHQAMEYQVGDIAAYYNADINGNVFHRIVGLNLDHFIFKGDNNSWLDSYQPGQEDLIGKLWLHLPKVGNAITWVRTPLNMAFTVGILGGVIMAGSLLEQPERKGKKKNNKKTSGTWTGPFEGYLFGLGFLFLASLALGVHAFTHPTRKAADPIQYQQSGSFLYSAAAEPGIYDGEKIRTGEPIFPALTCPLHLQFVYSLSPDLFQDLRGTHQFTARIIEEQSNWQRTIPLETATIFSGNTYTSSAMIDLCEMEALVEKMEEVTDFHPANYRLAIIPSVSIAGTYNGTIFQETFEPSLNFRFDKIHFYLDNLNPDADALNPTKTSLLQDPGSVPNRLSLFGIKFLVATLRTAAVIGLALAIIGSIVLAFLLSIAAQQNPDAIIRMKYGGMLVHFSGKEPGLSAHPVEVASIDDLAKIAERFNSIILHEANQVPSTYYLNSEGKTYRYKVQAGKDEPKDQPAAKRTRRGKDAL